MFSILEVDNNVIKKGICTGCGACQGMCPYWKSFKGRTFVDYICDRQEGRCKHFCPRMPEDLEALRNKFFDEADLEENLGAVKGVYLTRAADPEFLKNAQNGGTITALINLAFEEGIIDSAVLSKAEGTLNPKGMLAASKEEFLSCQGSSYQIAPTLSVLNEALGENKYKKIGVVGTPCKTLATFKMKAKPFAENENNADNISLVIGTFCGWGLDWDGIEKYGPCKHAEILPSKFHRMDLDDRQIDLDEILPIVRSNCLYCADMTAEFSDISVGEARSPLGFDEDKGWNTLIVRSEKGKKLVDLAREKNVLEFRDGFDLEKLKKASGNKKKTAVKNLIELTGSKDDLSYLEPSRKMFEKFI